MKIYYVANARMPNSKAHGIQLAKMCEAFVAAGADLEFILPNKAKNGKSLKEFYGLKSDIKTKTLPVLDLLPETSVGFLVSAATFAFSSFFYLLFKADKNGIIYTIDLDPLSFMPLRLLGKPYFFESHGAKRKNFFTNLFIKNANGVVAVSPAIGESFKNNFNVKTEKIIVAPNGSDTGFNQESKEEARRRLGLPLDKKIILYTGRFYHWKGLDILPEAGRRLRDDAEIYLVGGGAREFTEATAAKPSENMRFAGSVPYRDISLWLSAADIFLVLGTKKDEYSYFQTSPMKLFGYMAFSRPIIASATPAIRSAVSDQEVIFCEPDDSKDLAEKINEVLENPEKFAGRAQNALKKAAELSWEKRAAKISDFINQNL